MEKQKILQSSGGERSESFMLYFDSTHWLSQYYLMCQSWIPDWLTQLLCQSLDLWTQRAAARSAHHIQCSNCANLTLKLAVPDTSHVWCERSLRTWQKVTRLVRKWIICICPEDSWLIFKNQKPHQAISLSGCSSFWTEMWWIHRL